MVGAKSEPRFFFHFHTQIKKLKKCLGGLSQEPVPGGEHVYRSYRRQSGVSILFPLELWTVCFGAVASCSQQGDAFESERIFRCEMNPGG